MSEETSQPEESTGPNLSLLAEQAFGTNFHGEVPEPPPPPADPPPEEAAPEAPEEAAPVDPPPEEVAADPVEEPGEETEQPIESVAELIEAGEYDPEWFNSLAVDVKVDGSPSKAKISDLVASYQMNQAADKRLEEAKEKAKSQNQALARKSEELDKSFQVAAAVLQKQKNSLVAEEQAIDANNSLRSQDPAEWAAKKQEIADRKKQFDIEVTGFLSVYQQQKAKKDQDAEGQRQEKLTQEQALLLEALPEWSDDELRAKEQVRLGEYLTNQTLDPTTFEVATYDHKMLLMARKAMLYDEIKSKAEPSKKRLQKVPKTLKPGASKPKASVQQTQERQLQDIISGNPNSRDALEAATKLMQLKRGS